SSNKVLRPVRARAEKCLGLGTDVHFRPILLQKGFCASERARLIQDRTPVQRRLKNPFSPARLLRIALLLARATPSLLHRMSPRLALLRHQKLMRLSPLSRRLCCKSRRAGSVKLKFQTIESERRFF